MKALIAGLVLAAAATIAVAGTTGRNLQSNDYDLWHQLFVGSVSPDGKYLSYTTKHPARGAEPAAAVHVVVDTLTGREVARVPGSAVPEGRYSPDSKWYVARDSGDTRLVNLDGDETIVSLTRVARYGFTSGSDYLVAWERGEDASQELGKLIVIGLKGANRIELEGVTSHELSADGRTLAFVQESNNTWEFRLIGLGQSPGAGRVLLTTGNELRLLDLGAGDSFSLIEEADTGKERQGGPVTHYFEPDGSAGKYRHYRHSHGTGVPANGVVRHQWHSSERGPVIIFGEASAPVRNAATGLDGQDPTDKVQVWHSMDSRIVTDRKRKPVHRYSAWWPRTGKMVNITDDHSSIQFVTKDAAHALVRSSDGHIRDSYSDLGARRELVDLATGERKILFEGGENQAIQDINGSPSGRYIAYVANSGWWIHDLQDGTRRLVDPLIDQPLLKEDWDRAGHVPPYGSAGWTTDGELALYDRQDVWLVAPETMSARKITDGRSTSRVYRHDRAGKSATRLFDSVLDTASGIVLSVFNESTKQSGYSIYREGAGVTDLVYEDAHIERILERPGLGFVHTRERFDAPPEIVAVDSTGRLERVIFRSNAHHSDFKWGEARLVDYVGKSGRPLQGILLYPADYREDKVYPMIVSIYERQSHLFHRYQTPSNSSYMP